MEAGFNLRAVVRETGIAADTLRAWERRYGVPSPRRSAGGHRLYSRRDIDSLRWLVARQADGLTISRAVALWRSLEARGEDPLRAPGFAIPLRLPSTSVLTEGEAIAQLREAWLEGCRAFDEPRAEHHLAQAFAVYPLETVCLEIMGKGLNQIGEEWYRGEASVQQEHFTSELAARRLGVLLEAAPPPTRPGRVMVACPPEERHVFAPLLITLLLRRRGRSVAYLGSDVPLERFIETAAAAGPNLVILVAQRLPTAVSLADVSRVLRRAGYPVAFGGRVFVGRPDLAARVPAHHLGDRLDLAVWAAERLLESGLPPIPTVMDTPGQAVILPAYREGRPALEAQLADAAEDLRIPPDLLATANHFMAESIEAGLALGDMTLVDPEIEWLDCLLHHRHMPVDWLRRYLEVYRQAARQVLTSRAAPVLSWLERRAANGAHARRVE
jgi:DNA-binding transcriptional MerR regulator